MLSTRTRHRFSVADYNQMIDEGILTENDRVELIRGEIIDKMSIGELHAACVRRLTNLLVALFGSRVSVSIQNPVRLEDSVPEPDVAILRQRDDDYATSHPEPKDVLLIIEVADSSLDFDRGVKLPLYAENGVVECWIVNLLDQSLEVYRNPSNGGYVDSQVLHSGDVIELLSLPGTPIPVAKLVVVK